jgi:hypothetical protein
MAKILGNNNNNRIIGTNLAVVRCVRRPWSAGEVIG